MGRLDLISNRKGVTEEENYLIIVK
jgi:hypothetical protein